MVFSGIVYDITFPVLAGDYVVVRILVHSIQCNATILVSPPGFKGGLMPDEKHCIVAVQNSE